MASIEKAEPTTMEVEAVPKLAEHSNPDQLAEFDPKRARSIRRKVDLRLLPALAFMYAICLIDRNNLAALALAGMTVELKIVTGYGYKYVFPTQCQQCP
jgi:hypothetical protein